MPLANQSAKPESKTEEKPVVLQAKLVAPEPKAPEPEIEPAETIVLFDTGLLAGLNTVRFSIQVPVKVKTQDGEATMFDEIAVAPGLQSMPTEKWKQIESSTNTIVVQALHHGAIRRFMKSADDFDRFASYEAFDCIKRCIDESSLKLLRQWINGSLAAQNAAVRDALSTQIAELSGNDSFAQARQMLPQASV